MPTKVYCDFTNCVHINTNPKSDEFLTCNLEEIRVSDGIDEMVLGCTEYASYVGIGSDYIHEYFISVYDPKGKVNGGRPFRKKKFGKRIEIGEFVFYTSQDDRYGDNIAVTEEKTGTTLNLQRAKREEYWPAIRAKIAIMGNMAQTLPLMDDEHPEKITDGAEIAKLDMSGEGGSEND